MLFFKKSNKTKKISKKSIEDKILGSVMKKVRKINVVSPLNNRAAIFNKTLDYAIAEGKKILYIINKDKDAIDLSAGLANYIDDPYCEAVVGKINICSHNVGIYLEEKFDLIIYDEVNSRPMYTRESISKLMCSISGSYGTMITYSIEPVFRSGITIYNLKEDLECPIAEPRFISTRVKLEEGIPNCVYDYLKWSINTNNKVIIYVPHKEQVDKIYKGLKDIKDNLTSNIYRVKSDDSGRKRFIRFLLAEEGILITDDFNEEHIGLKPVNIMVFFADSDVFTYKDLVYISSRVNRVLKNTKEEVMFICNNETEDMDKCRSILRELNKKAWEQGYFRR